MTNEEKTVVKQKKIESLKYFWANRPQTKNWDSWTLNEETVAYEPPIPRPEPDQNKLDQKIFTAWCGADNNWKDTPVRPEGNYKFDFFAWQWVEITK